MSIIGLALYALELFKWILLIRAVLSWIPNMSPYRYPAVRLLHDITEPVLRPIRMILPPEKTGYIDFSPLIAFFIIGFLESLLGQLAVRQVVRTIPSI